MAGRSFSSLPGDDGDMLRLSIGGAVASLKSCGWWASDRVAASLSAMEPLRTKNSSVLALADLLESSAEYMEGLVGNENKSPGSIYSGDAGDAYALLRKAERLLAKAEAAPSPVLDEDPEVTLAVMAAEAEGELAMTQAADSLHQALSILSKEEEVGRRDPASVSLRRRFTFLQGQAGRLALAAVCLHLLKKESEAFSTLRRLAAVGAAAASHLKPEDCDLLFGRAGLLYALLFTRVLWLPPPRPSFVSSASAEGISREETQQEQQEQQEQQQQEEKSCLFNDPHESEAAIRSSSSSSSTSSTAELQEAYLTAAYTSIASSGSIRGAWLATYCTNRGSILGSSIKCSSRQELMSFSSRRFGEDREATVVLLLSLIAQLVGHTVAQGRVGAVVSEGGSMMSLDQSARRSQPASASAAFSRYAPLSLIYEWHEKRYLGAAHGLCGILLQLLQAVDTLHQAAVAGCFPGPAATVGRAAAAAASAARNRETPQEEAESAAARLLACSSCVCNPAQKKGEKDPVFFCGAASALLCCRDGVAATVALRDTVRRFCLFSLLSLVRSYLTETLNLRSSIGSTKDVLVQWCHGAPGLLPLLCWAVNLHREEALLPQQQKEQRHASTGASGVSFYPLQQQQVEQRGLYRRKSAYAGELEACAQEDLGFFLVWLDAIGSVTWRRGLLTKGLGICHGIGGNGLALLCAYRNSGHPKWLRRAVLFALEGVKRHQQLLSVPDRPFSLFEGVAGFALFLRDCAELLRVRCSKNLNATFYYPGYELPPLPWQPWKL